jgi:hypothetical protein
MRKSSRSVDEGQRLGEEATDRFKNNLLTSMIASAHPVAPDAGIARPLLAVHDHC